MNKFIAFIILTILVFSMQFSDKVYAETLPVKNDAFQNSGDRAYLKDINNMDIKKRNIKIDKIKFDKDKKIIDNGIVNITSNGDGINNLSFTNFTAGDMVVGRRQTCDYFAGIFPCYWNHLSLYDSDYDYNKNDLTLKVFWSAYPNSSVEADVNGKVGRQTKQSIRNYYDQAHGIWTPNEPYSERYNTTWYAYYQSGESYDALSDKTNSNTWYCSKLAWKAYKDKAGIDIDYNKDYWVLPDDIYQSSFVKVFTTAE